MSIFRPLFPHFLIGIWIFAAVILWRTVTTFIGLRRLPNIADPKWDTLPAGDPSLVAIIPARDEAATLEPALRSLLAQDHPRLRIVAVDDRSADATPALLDSLAAEHPDRLSVLHIQALPEGWLGKTHAMAVGAEFAQTHFAPDFLLFADADVHFAPDALRRSLAAAVAEQADHFVTLPTPVIRRGDEAAFLSFFQVLSFFSIRLWRVADPTALHDSIGVGAFALLRSDAYTRLGGFAALRMEVLEDLYLGRRVKHLGMRQRVALGQNFVRVHWASGALGIAGVLTKNLFALFRFRIALVLFVSFWLVALSVLPLAALFFPGTRLAGLLLILCATVLYWLAGRLGGISAANVVWAPFASLLLTWSLLRSTLVTLRGGGVRWRGTFYSLPDLRRSAGPLFPSRPKSRRRFARDTTDITGFPSIDPSPRNDAHRAP